MMMIASAFALKASRRKFQTDEVNPFKRDNLPFVQPGSLCLGSWVCQEFCAGFFIRVNLCQKRLKLR